MEIPRKLVIIIGPYRSGTSITSRLIAALGASFGDKKDLVPPDERNPSGYLERDDVNTTNTAFIESAGGSLERPGPPEALLEKGDVSLLETHNLDWIKETTLAGLKDPRMCATLNAWLASGKLDGIECHVVHVLRDLDRTAASSAKHAHVAAYCDGELPRLRKMAERYDKAAKWQVARLDLPTLQVTYEDILRDPETEVRKLADFLSVTSEKKIRRAIAHVGKKRANRRLQFRKFIGQIRFQLGALRSRLMGR